jgi:predicted porin
MRIRSAVHALLVVALGAALAPAPVRAADRIDELIERLDRQDREIRALREELQALRAAPPAGPPGPEIAELREDLEKLRQEAAPPPKHPEWFREDGEEPVTNYPNPAIRLDIAGQINQAMNLAGDGDDTKLYFVDNDTSNSRIRFAGVSTFEDGPELGTTLEIAFSGNNSFDVGQSSELSTDLIRVRRADLHVVDERFGRLMFGRGNAASDNTAEYDLSLVGGPIMMSGIAFPIGGLQFTSNDVLTGVTVGDAFFNFDGDRQNRLRYDTPMFGPLQLSGSIGSDQRYDVALTLGGDYDHWTGYEVGPFTMLGAVSIADPNQFGVDYRMAGSWSLLHGETGLSLTVSSGFFGGAAARTPYNVYSKLAWDTRILPFGRSGFGVDYTWTENVTGSRDQGQSVGIAAIQELERYGIELYTQYRWLTLDVFQTPDFDDINVYTLGSRVRF